MRESAFVNRYFESLLKEFETVTQYLDKSRLVSQIHWGGGTPNYCAHEVHTKSEW
ncbi:MAG: hypothetical protein HC905_21510 [Bacteroidales bacterium]|nr:hypothetical protein [Bacteroidales bacterium]